MTGKSSQSLQDILKRRQSSDVVGRDTQINDFRANLVMAPDDERRRFIFNIFGQGGIGKTTLIRQFRQIAQSSNTLTAYIDEGIESEVDIMGSIAEQFKEQSHPLSLFEERYRVYQQRKQELENDPELPQGGVVFASQLITKVGLRLGKLTPLAPFVDLVDADATATQIGEWTKYVISKINNKDEVQLVLKPIEVLTPLFLKDLNTTASTRQFAIFIDTYEHTGQFLDQWLRYILDGKFGGVPDRILITIAGRSELDRNLWSSFSPIIARIELEPFTKQEAEDFLARKGITNQKVVNVIIRLSGGLPLLVAMLASQSPNDSQDIEDPTSTAVERFLKWVDDPSMRKLALNTALSRHINKDVIAQIVIGQNTDELFSWLKGMPFVEERGGYWTYHPVVRESMLRHKHHESKDEWGDLHGRLAAYYEKQISDLGLNEQDVVRNIDWQSFSLDSLYHRLCQNSTKNLIFALNGFLRAMDENLSFARRWANTIGQAGDDANTSELQEWGKSLLECLAAYDDNRFKEAELIFNRLLEVPTIDNQLRAIALGWRGNINYLMDNYQEALEDFDKAININSHYGWVFARRGDTYRLLKNYENALSDLGKALEIKPKDDWAFASRGLLYEELEQYDSALSDYSQAIKLDSKYIWALNRRQKLYRLLKRNSEALIDIEQLIEIETDNFDWDMARLEVLALDNNLESMSNCITNLENRIPSFIKIFKDDSQRELVETKERLQKTSSELKSKAEDEFIVDILQEIITLIDTQPKIVDEIARAIIILIKVQAFANCGRLTDGLKILDNSDLWNIVIRNLKLIRDIFPIERFTEIYLKTEEFTAREIEDVRNLVRRIIGLIDAPTDQISDILRAAWCLYQGFQYSQNDQAELALQALEEVKEEITEPIIWAVRASIHNDLKSFESAVSDLNRAIQIDPNSNLYLPQRGEIFNQMNRHKEALLDFDKALEEDPYDEQTFGNRGEVYEKLELYEQALADYSKAISLDAKYQWAIVHRGNVYRAMGNYDAALEDFSHAINRNSKYARAFTNRGRAYHELKRYEEAMVDFNNAIKIDSAYAWPYVRRAITQLALLKHEDAWSDLNRAIEIDNKYDWAIFYRGKTHREFGNYENALNDLTQAIEITPEKSAYYYHRSLVYYSMNQKENGDQDISEAIRLAESKYEQKPYDQENLCNLALYNLVATNKIQSDKLYQQIITADIAYINIYNHLILLQELTKSFPNNYGQIEQLIDLLEKKLKKAKRE
jgi:tetratricopeptide (TPR) repeat protein